MKCIYFFGDSLTLGVNDRKMQGWTGRFGIMAQEAMEKKGSGFPAVTIYNLGVRKHASTQIRKRWEAELEARILDGAEIMTVFCFGTVDMAAPAGSVNVPVSESVGNAREILSRAREKSQVMMISPPPVENPVHTGRIQELSEAYQALCMELDIPYCNMLPKLKASKEYMESLEDGIHPGESGCDVFAEILMTCTPLKYWLLND